MTSRELVRRTLEFENKEGRVPRDLWYLNWYKTHHQRELQDLMRDYPVDFKYAPAKLETPITERLSADGKATDDWGVSREEVLSGISGQVKTPLVADDDWNDTDNVHIPLEYLSFDADEVNRFCRSTDYFVLMPWYVNPFERLQSIRTTELFLMDLAERNSGMLAFLKKLHSFHCDLLERWAKTEVDALIISDDWGAQNSLLINPNDWVEIFKPLYKDYIDIAHRVGKKVFMHSDGYTVDIYPHLIEIGLDAFNSQIFCMGIEKLEQFAGKITFWGEMDRQHLLVNGTPKQIDEAVGEIYKRLWREGGCIAQLEAGLEAKPENVLQTYKSWLSQSIKKREVTNQDAPDYDTTYSRPGV
jgi:hypothetical protein